MERQAVRAILPPLYFCNILSRYGGISSRLMLFLILNNFIVPSIRKRFPPDMVNPSVAFVLSVAAAKMWLHEGKPPQSQPKLCIIKTHSQASKACSSVSSCSKQSQRSAAASAASFSTAISSHTVQL